MATLTVEAYNRAGTLLATLDESHTRSWLDEHNGKGQFSVALDNDDPDLASVPFGAILRFKLDGTAHYGGIVRGRNVTTYAEGEEHDQITVLSGPNVLGVLDEWVVPPSRGAGSLPIEQTRVFFWGGYDFDDSGPEWVAASQISQQSTESEVWDDTYPESWPNPSAWWIWGNKPGEPASNTNLAPPGTCLFRKSFTLASDTRVRIFGAFDNVAVAYLDGAQIIEGDPNFVKTRFVEVDLTAGPHVLAVNATNGPDDGAPGLNPGGIIMSVHPVDDEGLLDAAIVATDSTWKVLPYVSGLPGISMWDVWSVLIGEAQGNGALTGVTLDFNASTDSGGQAWDLFPEVAVTVGDKLTEVARKLAGSMMDVAMTPTLEFQIWNYLGRGSTPGVSLANTSDPDTSELLQLVHDGRQVRTNYLLIFYANGTTEIADDPSIVAHGWHADRLDLRDVRDEAEALRIGAEVLALRSDPRYATTARVFPSSDLTTPYLAFGVGDNITCTNEAGTPESMVVRSITVEEDDDGVLEYTVELNDISVETEMRHEEMLRRALPGMLSGGTRVAVPVDSPPLVSSEVTRVQVSTLSYQGTVPNGTAVKLLLNGVQIGSTLTFTASEASGAELRTSLGLEKVHASADQFQLQVGSAISQFDPESSSGNLLKFVAVRTLAADGTEGVVAHAIGI